MKLKLIVLTFITCVALNCAAYAQSETTSSSNTSADTQQAKQGDALDAIERAIEAQRKAFTGAWEGIVTPEAGGPPPFRILFTFGGDGTVVAADSGPPSPQLGSSEHGAWERTGNNEFLVIYKQLLFTADGDLDSTFKGRVKFTLNSDGNQINGTLLVDLFDPQGNKFLSGAGTIKCTKIKVEPLN